MIINIHGHRFEIFTLVYEIHDNVDLQKMIVVEASFIDELSGMAMVKVLVMNEQTTNMIKLKFIRKKAMLKITNKLT